MVVDLHPYDLLATDGYDPIEDGIVIATAPNKRLPSTAALLHWGSLGAWLDGVALPDKAAKAEAAVWLGAVWRHPEGGLNYGSSKKEAELVHQNTLMIFDFDEKVDWQNIYSMVKGGVNEDGSAWSWRCFAHTSWSHTDEKPKVRLAYPLVRPVPAALWPNVWSAATAWAKSHGLINDVKTSNSNHIYYIPSFNPAEMERCHRVIHPGQGVPSGWDPSPRGHPLLDPAWLAATFPEAYRSGGKAQRKVEPVVYESAARRRSSYQQRRDQDSHQMAIINLLKYRINALQSKSKGARSNYTYGAGRLLGGGVYYGWMGESEAQGWINDITRAAMVVGLEEKEAYRQAKSGYDDGIVHGDEGLYNSVSRG